MSGERRLGELCGGEAELSELLLSDFKAYQVAVLQDVDGRGDVAASSSVMVLVLLVHVLVIRPSPRRIQQTPTSSKQRTQGMQEKAEVHPDSSVKGALVFSRGAHAPLYFRLFITRTEIYFHLFPS